MWRRVMQWLRRWLLSKAQVDVDFAVPESPPVMLGTLRPPPVAAPEYLTQGRVLRFRGERWREKACDEFTVTFVREVSVNGRAVESEVRVLRADLVAQGEGWILNGRD